MLIFKILIISYRKTHEIIHKRPRNKLPQTNMASHCFNGHIIKIFLDILHILIKLPNNRIILVRKISVLHFIAPVSIRIFLYLVIR